MSPYFDKSDLAIWSHSIVTSRLNTGMQSVRACILPPIRKPLIGCPLLTKLSLRYKAFNGLGPSYFQENFLSKLHRNNFTHVSRDFCRCQPKNGQNKQLPRLVLSPLWLPPCGIASWGSQGSSHSLDYPQSMQNWTIQEGSSAQIMLHCTKWFHRHLDKWLELVISTAVYSIQQVGFYYVIFVLLTMSC